ncbi:DUF4328 domain-containing protein [Nocardia testacea]|uniref:DUF4328 domain-containing protein n=1 Tax=Nocardia testacea TaxID=248551 RepID=UPI000A058AAC
MRSLTGYCWWTSREAGDGRGTHTEWQSCTWAGIISAILQLGAGVTVISWLWRARCNAEAMCAARHRLSIGWVIGGWFCPVVNVWLPHTIMSDVWRASDLRTPPDALDLRGRSVSGWVTAWWLFLLLGWVLGFVALVLSLPERSQLPPTSLPTGASADALLVGPGTQTVPRTLPLRASDPPTIGPYALIGRLGSGTRGDTYLGCAPGTDNVVVQTVHLDRGTGIGDRTEPERVFAAAVPPTEVADVLPNSPRPSSGPTSPGRGTVLTKGPCTSVGSARLSAVGRRGRAGRIRGVCQMDIPACGRAVARRCRIQEGGTGR